jgi:hypothetical protein
LKETKQTQAEANMKRTKKNRKGDFKTSQSHPPFHGFCICLTVSHHTMLVCCHSCLLLLFGWSDSLHCCGAEEIAKDASDPVLQEVFQ